MTNTNTTETQAIDTTHVLECKDGTRIETTWHDTARQADDAREAARVRGADLTRRFLEPRSCLGKYRVAAYWMAS